MNLPVRLTRRSTADWDRLAAFIAQENPHAAERAISTLAAALDRLAAFPEIGVMGPGCIRSLVIPFGKAGYVVRYRIDRDAIVVARILHTRERR